MPNSLRSIPRIRRKLPFAVATSGQYFNILLVLGATSFIAPVMAAKDETVAEKPVELSEKTRLALDRSPRRAEVFHHANGMKSGGL